MTITYNEWRAKEIKNATNEAMCLMNKAKKLNESLGTELINPNIYLIMLQETINNLTSKDTLRWFLQNQEEIC